MGTATEFSAIRHQTFTIVVDGSLCSTKPRCDGRDSEINWCRYFDTHIREDAMQNGNDIIWLHERCDPCKEFTDTDADIVELGDGIRILKAKEKDGL